MRVRRGAVGGAIPGREGDLPRPKHPNANHNSANHRAYRVSDFTWKELSTLDAGSWFGRSRAGERIISVRDVIEQVRGRKGLLAEISPCGHHEGLPEDLDASFEPDDAARRHPQDGRPGVDGIITDYPQSLTGR